MAFHPDIVVTGPDSSRVLIAVEARTNEREFRSLAEDIRTYLLRMSCPLGLLVFPDKLWLYRNTYSGADESSIEELGPYRMPPAVLRFRGIDCAIEPRQFEASVQHWLQELADRQEFLHVSPELQAALEAYVLPSLASGEIRAAGPRTASPA
jgi:hypothetical protein